MDSWRHGSPRCRPSNHTPDAIASDQAHEALLRGGVKSDTEHLTRTGLDAVVLDVSLPGYTLDVRLDVFGEVLDSQEILAQDILPDHFGVEVLLGMDLVPGRIFTLDGVRGTLSVVRPA